MKIFGIIKTHDGYNLQSAYLFLAPYLSGQKEWEWGSVRENEQTELVALPMMKRAAKKYDSTILMQAVRHLQDFVWKKFEV